MSLRLQEMHPVLVHLPITLLPLAVGADLLGRVTDSEPLLSFGRKAMVVAAAGALASVVTGLIAGEEVNVEGKSRDMLMTHRNLNFVGAIVASWMAFWRARHRPNATYLGVGAAATGVLGYTGYLGGKLISEFGVGVRPAQGIYRPDAPALGAAPLTAFAKAAGTDLVHGVQHMIQEVGRGQLAPALVGGSGGRRNSAAPIGGDTAGE